MSNFSPNDNGYGAGQQHQGYSNTPGFLGKQPR